MRVLAAMFALLATPAFSAGGLVACYPVDEGGSPSAIVIGAQPALEALEAVSASDPTAFANLSGYTRQSSFMVPDVPLLLNSLGCEILIEQTICEMSEYSGFYRPC